MNSAPVLAFGQHAPGTGRTRAPASLARCRQSAGSCPADCAISPLTMSRGEEGLHGHGAPSEADVGLTALADFDRISGP